jgi:hypothetical protein
MLYKAELIGAGFIVVGCVLIGFAVGWIWGVVALGMVLVFLGLVAYLSGEDI